MSVEAAELPKVVKAGVGLERGLVQVYTGDGKGKTTAALGLALRAAGHRFSVAIIQFVKGASYTGEVFAIERLYPEVEIFQFGRDCKRASAIRQGFLGCRGCTECFLGKGEITEEDRELAGKALAVAYETVAGGEKDIVILDEISLAAHFGLISVDDIVGVVQAKKPRVELVLTGRHMPEEVLALADLITEMHQVKHPFEQGIVARRGIEY
ncbi:MAG: cob(I)yrinic acid a,c-diamide adenosyltransferase [Bacillota bacterium]